MDNKYARHFFKLKECGQWSLKFMEISSYAVKHIM